MAQQTRNLTKTALGAALLAVSAWITIPIGAVPVTLQTFAVFLLFALLGGKLCSLATAVYLLLGAFGLPVFSGFKGGIGALMGATGGYLVGFLVAALVMWALEKPLGHGTAALAGSMVLGLLICYAFGTAWFYFVYLGVGEVKSVGAILAACVIPFIPVDAVKVALALLLGKRLRPHIK
ncbi:MAG: biotin transporter BioY [Oscillospiraceae bacterium]